MFNEHDDNLDGLDNEGLAYPEVVKNATAWAASEKIDEGTILVSRQRLKELLNLVGDIFPVAMGALLKLHSPSGGDDMYSDALTKANLIRMTNASSKVFCEGTLIVSGLFIGSDGKPIMNPCADKSA